MDKTVAFIPLRGGSKSIPHKNIKMLGGKPLAYWTIEAAANSEIIDTVYVATDSSIIADSVNLLNHPKVKVISRSAESATDTASTEYALLEFCNQYEFEEIFLIQATSPLLTSEDLSKGYAKLHESGADSLLSVVLQKRFIWEGKDGFAEPTNYDYMNRPRRQDFDGYFVENGAFYISSRAKVLEAQNRISGKIAVYEMDESSFLEIDEPQDWIAVENLLKSRTADKAGNSLNDKLRKIKLIATDVDGVLTDAGMYYTETGDELKKFNTKDGKGFEMLRNIGIKTAIVTTENTQIVARRAKKLKMDYLYQACMDKVVILQELSEVSGFALDEIAFIGDDLNDFDALKTVGFSATPADACSENKGIVDYICEKKGGEGCVRELCELILKSR